MSEAARSVKQMADDMTVEMLNKAFEAMLDADTHPFPRPYPRRGRRDFASNVRETHAEALETRNEVG
jgi:hypothetical protein